MSFHTVPTTDDAGPWADQPLALVHDDFTFYDAAHTLIQHGELHRRHVQAHVQSVHIQFRFNKSPRNFSIPKFQLTKNPIVDPVSAANRCLHWADLLHHPLWEPVGGFGSVS